MKEPIAQGPVDVNVRGGELYMDATDYEHELGECTTALYASVEDLKASRACVSECGIVAVRVVFLRVVEPGMPYGERGKETPNALGEGRERGILREASLSTDGLAGNEQEKRNA